MKKISLFLILSLIAVVFACKNKELEQLRKERDSLLNASTEQKKELEMYFNALKEIQQNLNVIKQKEKLITLNTTDTTEITPSIKDQINNDILTIYQLLEENKNALDKLKKQVKNSGIKNKQLLETIALYEQQLKDKDEEIRQLKQKLENMNLLVGELNQKIESMQQKMETLEKEQEQQRQIISQQESQINTVYYIIGTKTELKDKQIITREGFLSKLTLDPNADKSNFAKADKRELVEIPINANNIQILSSHPSSSYTLKKNNKGIIERLVITNTDDFWSLSKVLVIMVK